MRELINREGTHIPSPFLPKGDLNSTFMRKYEKMSQTLEKNGMPDLTLLPEGFFWATSGHIIRNINLLGHPRALHGSLGTAGHTSLSSQQLLCWCQSNRPNILLAVRCIQHLHIQRSISSVSVIHSYKWYYKDFGFGLGLLGVEIGLGFGLGLLGLTHP